MISPNENIIPLVEISNELFQNKGIRLYLLREDLIHTEISGNKWRKLKYNISYAKAGGKDSILSFGGAYSNHIAALAAAGKHYGLKTIGIIRGERIEPLNNTLKQAEKNGMTLKFITREKYRNKSEKHYIDELQEGYPSSLIVPEGGSNAMAVEGCAEILNNVVIDFDVVAAPCGTGGTLAGLIASSTKEVLGFPALKGGEFLKDEIIHLLEKYEEEFDKKVMRDSWNLICDYHFGGYAKVTPDLISFVQDFKNEYGITLDLIYTGKMMFGIFDMIKTTQVLDGKTIIAIHTGGVQGNKGFEERLGIRI
jgi:1-aminocyclopropane-1-carboxylate deaminase/D-cysteine desulfhydrase-like pyridoxal-dependent ACC family enzyme